MNRSLRALLALDRASFAERATLAELQLVPVCHPGLAASSGEAPFVTVDGDSGALWRLRIDPLSRLESRPALLDASRALERAYTATTRAVPFVFRSGVVGAQPRWHAYLVTWEGDDRRPPVAFEGASLGLAACLALATRAMDLPGVTDRVALVTLDDRCELAPVAGLETKLRVVADNALAASSVFVHASQEAEARAMARSLGRRLDVVPVSTLEEAMVPLASAAMDRVASASEDLLTRILDDLWGAVLDTRREIIGWRGIIRAATALLDTGRLSSDDAARARVVVAIAERHDRGDGGLREVIDRELHRLPVESRQKLLAQRVQDHTDSHHPSPHDEAKPWLEGSPTPELLGAASRAFGAVGAWRESADLARRAVEAWIRSGQSHEAGRPLCEWIRVAGVMASIPDLEHAEEHAGRLFEPHSRTVSRSFVQVARARAWVQVGAPGRALDILHEDGPPALNDPLVPVLLASRHRWLARALDATDPDAADDVRSELACRLPGEVYFVALSAIDRALRDASDATAALAAMRGSEMAYDLVRVERRCGEGAEANAVARRFAEESLY